MQHMAVYGTCFFAIANACYRIYHRSVNLWLSRYIQQPKSVKRIFRVSDGKLEYSFSENTIEVSSQHTFSSADQLHYDVYMGTQVGASDYVIGLATVETNIVFTSPKLVSPSSVHCVITAVTRAGAHVTHRETIYL